METVHTTHKNPPRVNTPQEMITTESPRMIPPERDQLQNTVQPWSGKINVIPEKMNAYHIISEYISHREDNTPHIIEDDA